MPSKRDRWIWAGAAGVSAIAGAGIATQQRIKKLIAADPEQEILANPPVGRSSSVTSADGTALHLELFGEDGGQTIVLVHGWTEELRYWVYVIRKLAARGFRVVAYDLRGHGHSGRALDGDYSLARFGEDLEAILEASVPEGQRALVAGHSLGAMSIAAWAEHHDVQRLVGAAALLNTGVDNLIADQLLFPVPKIARAVNELVARRGFLGARASLPRFSTPLSYAAISYVAFGPAAPPAAVAFYERMLVSCPPDVRADVGIAMSEMELHAVLPRLTVPTIVMAGEDDKLTPPSHARRIADSLPQLERLIVLPDTGHMGPLERPDEVSEALAQLASKVELGAGVAAA